MKVISCGKHDIKNNIYIPIISADHSANISDLFYLSTHNLELLEPSIIQKLNPLRMRSQRTLSTTIIRKFDDLQKIKQNKIQDKTINWLRSRIIRSFIQQHKLSISTSLSIALIFGEQSLIDYQQWHLFKDSGTAHLIAISGLHITLIGRMITRCIVWVLYRWITTNPLIYAEVIANIILIIYAFLAGMSPSCIRAVSTSVIHASMRMSYLRTDALKITVACLIIHCIIVPGDIASLGFQLSYGMVISLLSIDKIAHGRWKNIRSWLSVPCVSASWSLIYWKTAVINAPIANAIAVPWVSKIILPATLIGCISTVLSSKLSHMVQHIVAINWSLLLEILNMLNRALPPINLENLF